IVSAAQGEPIARPMATNAPSFEITACSLMRGVLVSSSVEPQIGDVARVLLEFAALDLFDQIDQALVGAGGEADLFALAHDKAVQELDLGAAALEHVLAHRRPLIGRAARLGQDAILVAGERLGIALARLGDHVRRQMVDLLELVAERLADADRLAAEPRLEAADGLVLRHVGAGQAGAGGNPVRHRVGDELRPALAPEVVGGLGAVGVGDEAKHLLRPLGNAAVHLAGAVDGMAAVLAADAAAVDVAGLNEADADIAGDAAQDLAPTYDAGDPRLVHAVLQ